MLPNFINYLIIHLFFSKILDNFISFCTKPLSLFAKRKKMNHSRRSSRLWSVCNLSCHVLTCKWMENFNVITLMCDEVEGKLI